MTTPLRTTSWLVAATALVALLAPAGLSTAPPGPDLAAGPATAAGLRAFVLDVAGPFVEAQGVADHVLASSRLAGQALQPVRLAPTDDPVALLQEAVAQALALQAASVAGMAPADWLAAQDGMAAALRMVEDRRDPATGASTVVIHDEESPAVGAGLEALRVDPALQWQAAFILATAVDQALPLFESMSMVTLSIATPLGDIVVDSGPQPCNNTYTSWLLLVIELCGNDVYQAPAGGADVLAGFPLSLIVDTDGNDHVVPATDTFPVIPSQAGALNGGIAVTVDTFGDDDRRSGTELPTDKMGAWGHTIGGAGVMGGFGLLVDQYGDDDNRVLGYGFPGKWGGGYFEGVGIHVDGNGHDVYGGDEFEEGAGWFNGLGIHANLADGDDYYYDYSTFAQGSGGYGGIGLLLDGIGNDAYETPSPFEQGAGHCGIGILADLTGSDTYDSPGYGQGYGSGCPVAVQPPPCQVRSVQDILRCCDQLLAPIVAGIDCTDPPCLDQTLPGCCDELLNPYGFDCTDPPCLDQTLPGCCDELLNPFGIDCDETDPPCYPRPSVDSCCDELLGPLGIACDIGDPVDPPCLPASTVDGCCDELLGPTGFQCEIGPIACTTLVCPRAAAASAQPAVPVAVGPVPALQAVALPVRPLPVGPVLPVLPVLPVVPGPVGPALPHLRLPVGIGVLLDQNGNDVYRAGWLGQGAHLGSGIGALLDAQGDDVYVAAECSQGYGDFRPTSWCSGAPLPLPAITPSLCPAFGQPIVAWLVAHVCPLPLGLGIGLLADVEGDDQYTLTGTEGQGAGYAGGLGLLVDVQGHDAYAAPLNVNGPVVDAGGLQPRGDWGAAIELL